VIRPMTPQDVAPLVDVQFATFNDLGLRMGDPVQEFTDEVRERGTARISHLQRTDPAGAWTAEVEGEPVGCALSLVRDGMWFLSLLIVKPGLQGKGIGRGLLEASLTTATDRSWIMSTVEPAAVRRYQRAGFALHPTYTAKGTADRTKIPPVTGIRDYDDDRETLDDVLRQVRGAAMGTEVEYFRERGTRIVVARGKGFAMLRPNGTNWLAATDDSTARDLLWTVLAEATEPVEIDWLAANQQWAIDVCLDAHLTLQGGASLALRGQPPMSPYLPCGAFG
jgi:GNAT superfamily N-acetyltransferase